MRGDDDNDAFRSQMTQLLDQRDAVTALQVQCSEDHIVLIFTIQRQCIRFAVRDRSDLKTGFLPGDHILINMDHLLLFLYQQHTV